MVLRGGDGMRVLLAEDEKRMAAALVALLKQEKYDVDHVSDGEAALVALESGVYDIAVLDVMMPEMNGFDVARNARRSGVKTPILMLTAKSQLDDKVEGLDAVRTTISQSPFRPRNCWQESGRLAAGARAFRTGAFVMGICRWKHRQRRSPVRQRDKVSGSARRSSASWSICSATRVRS